MSANAEPSQQPPRPRLRRRARVTLAVAAAIVVVAIAAARRTPGWYAARLAPRDAAVADRDARRLVTAVAGLRGAAVRPGDWGVALREDEINAWLATDLPRNHARALPAGLGEPRVAVEAGRIRVAARAAAGPFAGTLSLALEPRLRGVDRLECAVTEARLGAIPLPAGPCAHRLAALLRGLGFTAEVRRLDGRSAVVVSLGGHGASLRGLSVAHGEIAVAGTTEARR
ncbi:MAG: hypothetical protein ACKOZU_06165 [Planctomycetaceae bacterium]